MIANSFVFPIKDPDTFHQAIIYEKIIYKKYFLLLVGDNNHPSFKDIDSRKRNILIYHSTMEIRDISENVLDEGYTVVKILDYESIVPVIRAVGKRYPKASLFYAYHTPKEKILVECNLGKFPNLDLIDWT